MKTNQNENINQKDIDKLLKLIKRLGLQIELDKEIEERLSKFNSEPRDLGKPIEDPVIFEVDEELLKTIISLNVKGYNNGIEMIRGNIKETPETIEFSMSREEISGFIDAIIQACDEAFPE